MRLNQGYSYRQVLGPEAFGESALSYLAKHFSHSSLSQWRERILAGEVLLGERAAVGNEELRPGGVLIWNRPAWLEEDTPQSYGIIYQDEHLLAVDKPSGLPTIPGAGFYLNTLQNMVCADFPSARPLHRLGRATSGIVLFALDPATAGAMHRLWPKILKQYRALGSLVADQDLYDIRSPIGEQEHPRLGKVYAASLHGKPARSVARVVQRRADSTLFEVDLHSGRPHQIRIHLAFVGHPLVGDPLYAIGGQPKLDQPGLPGDAGYWLHALRLGFEHPSTQKRLELCSQLPEILRAV
jgi:23S rRNA pseudouridine1911/1915/1917 synthase